MPESSHTHSHSHDHGHAHGAAPAFHATFRDYAIGFLLSVVLTAVPFWLVMSHALGSNGLTAAVITLFAAVQMVVHMIYFLHMSGRIENGWNLLALIFTVLLVGIVVSGSSWVMYHLNANMMPTRMDMG